MVQGCILPQFYKDLVNPEYTTPFVIYHRRFSTNTTPKWPLAQPMRVLGHNGEINTLVGNMNWVKAREAAKSLPIALDYDIDEDTDGWLGQEMKKSDRTTSQIVKKLDIVDPDSAQNILQLCDTQDIPQILDPVVGTDRSDSANLDGVFELMTKSRHRASCALMALVPTAYEKETAFANNPEIVDFYKFHGGLAEAWDGPALLAFSDGKYVGASLDRNGLRPARYSITKDGTVYMMSETGVIPDLKEEDIVEKGRLGPGQMINVNLKTGEFKDNIAIKSEISSSKFYI